MNDALTVAQFNETINIQLQTIGMVSVVGEITEKNITRNSGLMMTIKDEKENAILKLSGFAPRIKGINAVEVGMKIVANGVPQLYSPYGSFSLNIVSVVPYGEGSLKVAYERLKKLLESKGYFAPERKRRLPEFVTKIVLITADGSAAYTDFLKILNENSVGLDIGFYPVSVQGKNAVDEIVSAFGSIKNSADENNVDCVVLTRGGGSLEDLIAFNSEEVAEAVFASPFPVLSAVGHERDTSISDMVADIVASTPSQAAYYLAQHNDSFIDKYVQSIDDIEQRILGLLNMFDYTDKMRILRGRIEAELSRLDFSDKLRVVKQRLDGEVINYKTRVNSFHNLLASYDPRKVLERGYAIVRLNTGAESSRDGKVIKSIKQLSISDNVSIKVPDGTIGAEVKKLYKS
ncbi:MAG: Exodeoxyribonuclease 7 large subunit [candidate division WS6 bacterium GW2011_GWA2_37_6]|uniref:Exodeoxyribonuclease 7 large subunit n=1 Tax=candidate division WS6 bacterium GW2011_GWA2_37_6 TaxID=1619087 RepID=A0A0G0JH64_9BACT|nr:MAG: Exodeoxyribonuclease 7 large subunit [candidate division WS6 bacterium GW2011_GWA2_37_6]